MDEDIGISGWPRWDRGDLQIPLWSGKLRQWGWGFDGMAYLCTFGRFQGGALPTGNRFQRVSWDAVGHPGRISDTYGCGVEFGDFPTGLYRNVGAWASPAKSEV